jgi:hypothetical protein
MKSNSLDSILVRKTRFFDLNEIPNILFIKSIRPGTYAKICFENGKIVIASYSLNYLNSIVGSNFMKVNRGVLVNKNKIISQEKSVFLLGGHEFVFSRREFKKQ